MSGVSRFEPTYTIENGRNMSKHAKGSYVQHSNYVKLEEENKRLQEENEALRNKTKMSPEIADAITEAAKDKKQSIIFNDQPVFINYGNEQDYSHLNCPACGGSGHIDDVKAIANKGNDDAHNKD